MQASDPDVLEQKQSFCVTTTLLHVGMNVPLHLQLDVSEWLQSRSGMELRTSDVFYIVY